MWAQSQSNILHMSQWASVDTCNSTGLSNISISLTIYQCHLSAKLQVWVTLKDCQFYTKLQTSSPSETLPLLYQTTDISCSETLLLLHQTTDITFIWNTVISLPKYRHKMIWNNDTFIPNYRQQLSLLLHRASCIFTNYHTTNKCTNCMSFIFKTLFKTLSLLLHVSIAYRLSSSGSTYSS